MHSCALYTIESCEKQNQSTVSYPEKYILGNTYILFPTLNVHIHRVKKGNHFFLTHSPQMMNAKNKMVYHCIFFLQLERSPVEQDNLPYHVTRRDITLVECLE